MYLQFIINGIIIGSVYSIVSLGFSLVYNTTRIFNISYAVIYTISGYISYTFFRHLGFPLVLSVIIAISASVFLNVIIELLIFKPLSKRYASLNVMMISSIGILIVITNLIAILYGEDTKILNTDISNSISFGNVIITDNQLIQLFVSTFCLIIFYIFLKFSKFGIKTRAMRDDVILSEVFGMDIYKMRVILFSIGGVFASIGGCLISYDVGMNPYVGMPMLLTAIVALIIGGVGRFEAPMIGGFIIGILQSVTVLFTSSKYQDAVTFVLLIIFLIFKPRGLLGEKQREV